MLVQYICTLIKHTIPCSLVKDKDPIMKTFISITYETSLFFAGKKKCQAKWYFTSEKKIDLAGHIFFSVSGPV